MGACDIAYSYILYSITTRVVSILALVLIPVVPESTDISIDHQVLK